MKFSYSEVWNDAVELLRSNATIVMALAGVFLFLPALLFAYFFPSPVSEDIKELVRLYEEYFRANWHWFLLVGLVSMAGEVAILILFLDARGRSVGALIGAAAAILPFYFLARLLAGMIIMPVLAIPTALGGGVAGYQGAVLGFLLAAVPALYLLGRLSLVSPHVAGTGERNPLTTISRSLNLSQGRGWAIAGLLVLIWIPAAIIAIVIGALLGLLFISLAGQEVGIFLRQILDALTGTAIEAVLLAVLAALYMRLRGGSDAKAD